MKWKFFLIAFVVSLLLGRGVIFFQEKLEDVFFARISQPLEDISLIEIRTPEASNENKKEAEELNLEITAKSAISVKIDEMENEKILFQKNINKNLPIASLTKLMTALVVLEDKENYDFSQVVTVSEKAISQDEDFGNLKIKDKLSVEDLLHIMLIESSNDAAYALAEKIEVEKFVEKMNQKAKTLGLDNTYFINPSGLDSEDPEIPNNLSTVKDLVKLAQYILDQHPIILDISSKMAYEVLDSWGQFHHLAATKNGLSEEIPDIIGGKTGFTNEAGGCMLLVLKDKDGYLINVILGTESPEARLEEMKKLINWVEL